MGNCVVRNCGYNNDDLEETEYNKKMMAEGTKKGRLTKNKDSDPQISNEGLADYDLISTIKDLEAKSNEQFAQIRKLREELARTDEPQDKGLPIINAEDFLISKHTTPNLITQSGLKLNLESLRYLPSDELTTAQSSSRRARTSREFLRKKIQANILQEIENENNLVSAKSFILQGKIQRKDQLSERKRDKSAGRRGQLTDRAQRAQKDLANENTEKNLPTTLTDFDAPKKPQNKTPVIKDNWKTKKNFIEDHGFMPPKLRLEAKIMGFNNEFFKSDVQRSARDRTPSPQERNILPDHSMEESDNYRHF